MEAASRGRSLNPPKNCAGHLFYGMNRRFSPGTTGKDFRRFFCRFIPVFNDSGAAPMDKTAGIADFYFPANVAQLR